MFAIRDTLSALRLGDISQSECLWRLVALGYSWRRAKALVLACN